MKKKGFGKWEKTQRVFLWRSLLVSLLTVTWMTATAADSAAVDWNDPDIRRQAVIETAYAYYLKSDCIQYDSAPLVAGKKGLHIMRKTIEKPPEYATPDCVYHTVCSPFPYETYFNAFGYRIGGSQGHSVTVHLACYSRSARLISMQSNHTPLTFGFIPAFSL